MGIGIYIGENKFQCSKCFNIVECMKEPKKCRNCGEIMENSFTRRFPPNNRPQKK